MNGFWIILTGALVAGACSLIGVFLILRRMSMIGDAIAHAVLPGIVASFLLFESRSNLLMLGSAAFVGVLTSFLIRFLHQRLRIQSDASIGFVFTSLFSIGVIMIATFASKSHIDTECVLYGEIAYIPLDKFMIEGISYGPRAAWIMGGVFVLVVAVLFVFRRAFELTTFDPLFGALAGFSGLAWHYVLMTLVSVTTVASFELVGAILVVAFLVVPPATAYLLSERLKNMIVLSLLFSFLSALGGYFTADFFNVSVSGAMASTSGFLFALVFAVKPLKNFVRITQKDLKFTEGRRSFFNEPQPSYVLSENDLASAEEDIFRRNKQKNYPVSQTGVSGE